MPKFIPDNYVYSYLYCFITEWGGETGKNFHLIHKLLIQCYNTLAIKKEMVKKKIQLWYNAFLICSQIYKTYLHSSPILDPRAHLQPEFFIIIIYTVIQGGIVNDFLIT